MLVNKGKNNKLPLIKRQRTPDITPLLEDATLEAYGTLVFLKSTT
jgi:hypothetical protein